MEAKEKAESLIENDSIKITMPFYHLKGKSKEVQIENNNILYSEIGIGYGLQINNEEKRKEIKDLCFEISRNVKELHSLLEVKEHLKKQTS